MNSLMITIETPRGSVEKYDYDKKLKAFKLHKILPSGMAFPYDFGFIPKTKGEDGDPLDVIVISEFKSFPGCYMECRIIGAIMAEQSEDGKMIRNDRYIAVSVLSNIFEDIHTVEDIPPQIMKDLEQFFVNYNKMEGKKFNILKMMGHKEAFAIVKKQLKHKR